MFEEAPLARAQVAALFAGVLYQSRNANLPAANGGPAAPPVLMQLPINTGTIMTMPAGTGDRLEFTKPVESAAYADYLKVNVRALAAGLGVLYESVSGDYEGVTFSAIRAGLNEVRRGFQQLQYNIVIPQFCRPVWRRFVELAALTEELPAADFWQRPGDYYAVEWQPQEWPYVNPLDDVEAQALAVEKKFKSRRQVVAENGFDVEQIDAEIAADRQRENRLGIADPEQVRPANAAALGLIKRSIRDLSEVEQDRILKAARATLAALNNQAAAGRA